MIVLVQAMALSLLMQSYAYPISVSILACIAIVAPKRNWLISLPGDRWTLLLGALFFTKFYFAPRQMPFDSQFIFSSFAYELAAFCLALELLLLYRKENKQKIPIWFLASAVIGLVFSGNIRLNHTQRITMLLVVQAFLFFSMLFAMKSRHEVKTPRQFSNRWRNSVMLFVIVVAGTLGTTTAVQLHRHERALEQMLSVYLEIGDRGPARCGFSNRGGLSDVSSWREFDGETLALRVESDSIPGYLRGKAFNEFSLDRWTLTRPSERLMEQSIESLPEEVRASISDAEHFYLVAKELPEESRKLKIWPVDNETAGHCFAPLESVALISRSRPIAVDPSRVLTRPSEQKVVSYTILANASAEQPQKTSFDDFLQVPELDERVTAIAEELYDNSLTARQKMKVTEEFFRDNFLYRKGVMIPRNEDRLGYFLDRRVAAHCEYFATATTILLRLSGVPARYVTGFYVQEQNTFDGSWIARRKHAHAWVEAYDDKTQKWVTVESTPSEGLPALTAVDPWMQRREMAAHFFRKIQEEMSAGNYLQAFWTLAQPLLWLLAFIGLAIGLVWALKRKPPVQVLKSISYQEFHKELVAQREKMDVVVLQYGFERRLDETTSQFANRIRESEDSQFSELFGAWYGDYSDCRFRPGYSEVQIAKLRDQRMWIQNQMKQQRKGVTSSV